MPQPSGQLALASGNSSEYFWYAQGSNGIWDARNSVLLTKTGTASMATEGGAQVALGDGATSYALASAITLAAPFTILWKCRTNASAGNNSMAWGNGAASDCLAWMDRSGNCDVRLANAGGYGGISFVNASPTTMATFAISMATNGSYVVYKNGSQVSTGSLASAPYSLKLSEILDGYTGSSFGLKGALEFVNIVPSVLTSGDVAARYSYPYSVLAAGSADATATTANVTGTSTIQAGQATGGSNNVDANAPAANVTGTSTINAGQASATASGSFTTETFENAPGSPHPAGTIIYWEWRVGPIGQPPTSVTYGPPGGTPLAGNGTLTITGLPLGAGELWARDAGTGRYMQSGTVT